jgi:hypothetical protein
MICNDYILTVRMIIYIAKKNSKTIRYLLLGQYYFIYQLAL